jgi:hypothetical protein
MKLIRFLAYLILALVVGIAGLELVLLLLVAVRETFARLVG